MSILQLHYMPVAKTQARRSRLSHLATHLKLFQIVNTSSVTIHTLYNVLYAYLRTISVSELP